VTFTDNLNGTATIAGRHGATQSYPVTLAAANGTGTASQSFTLSVAPGARCLPEEHSASVSHLPIQVASSASPCRGRNLVEYNSSNQPSGE